jgi:hypothetical protein
MRGFRFSVALVAALASVSWAAACGSTDVSTFPTAPDGGDGTDDATVSSDAPVIDPFPDAGGGDAAQAALEILPKDAVVDVVSGQATPTVAYTATSLGTTVAPLWTIDRGEIGSIDPSSGVFTPATKLGGKATISAEYKGKKTSTSVTVKQHVSQNGAPPGVDAGGGGVGGNGGVGGEGPGGAIAAGTKTLLLGTPTADAGLAWLYPYDKTLWPRGILPPLLQWAPGGHVYDAVYIHVTEGTFEYQGFFASTAAPFLHHPIPADVWKELTLSSAGEDVTVSLVFASGGVAYGPITETWNVANASLKGTVYYNSYGTRLAKNLTGALGPDTNFGGATLAIRGGSSDPVLVAGGNGGKDKCRVCHTVSADGSQLITQWGNAGDGTTSAYALASGNTETSMTPTDGRYSWGALYRDGSFIFSNSAPLTAGSSLPSTLYDVPSGAARASTGIPSGLRAGTPAFSPDGKHVAFNWYAGTVAAAAGDKKTLAMMDFDNTTTTFSGFKSVLAPVAVAPGPVGVAALFPSFFPTSTAIAFELETVANGRGFAETRASSDGADVGARGELWWVDTATKTAARLDKLNGVGLPQGPNAHDADATLNYEPTINPVASGGYAWVVFTSRRLYGNVATINPFWSDPRYHDISATPTPKKLWVAAIDLNAPPGTDPSHPAFYLPGQELLAGNSRGYWVVDPCKASGTSCETGDECCGGFCRAGADGGGLSCTALQPTCALEFEKCNVSADCCGAGTGVQCINQRCTVPGPK